MKNRICLITGGTSGVGKATATGLAKHGATFVIISSSEQHGINVVKHIKKTAGNDHIYSRTLDLGNLDSISNFVEQFKKEFGALHVLSNNAAVLPLKKEFTSNGIEKIFGINYLSHFVLSYRFIGLLKNSTPSRVITVSGNPLPISLGKIELDDFNSDTHFNPIRATYQAAVAKVAFSYELAKKLDGSGVTSNTFHPGLIKTNLTRHFPLIFRIPANLAQMLFKDQCETSVYLASSPEVETVSGKFFKNKNIIKFRPYASFEDDARTLWEKSKEISGIV
jgi:NAD(P)-dependent dehydrogenase (short-subunit alcohol dehydrogenase family)